MFSVAPKKQQQQQQTNKNANIRTNKQTESYIKSVIQITRYRTYSLMCPASMQIYENKRAYSRTCSVSMQFMGTWGERIHSRGEHLWTFLGSKEFLT